MPVSGTLKSGVEELFRSISVSLKVPIVVGENVTVTFNDVPPTTVPLLLFTLNNVVFV